MSSVLPSKMEKTVQSGVFGDLTMCKLGNVQMCKCRPNFWIIISAQLSASWRDFAV